MKLFHPKKHLPIPSPFTAADIRVESSICTGERTIGFYDPAAKRLCCAELVRTDDDIAAFYARYGLPCPAPDAIARS